MANITSANKTIVANRFFHIYQGEGETEQKLTYMGLMIELGMYAMHASRGAFNAQYLQAQQKVECMEELNKLTQLANNIKSKYKVDAKSDAMADAGTFFELLNEFNRKYPKNAISYEGSDIAGAVPDLEAMQKRMDAIGADDETGLRGEAKKALDAIENEDSDEYKNQKTKYEALKTEYSALKDAKSAYETRIKDVSGLGKWQETDAKYLKTITPYIIGYYVSNGGIANLLSNMQTAQSTLSSENEQQGMRTNQAMNRSSGFLQQLQNMMQSAKEALQAASKAGGS